VRYWVANTDASWVSYPVPASGSIAIKVINHYGDEVLKAYEVGEAR